MWRCMFKGLVEDTGHCSALSKIYLDAVAEVAEVAVEKDTLAALLTLMWVKKKWTDERRASFTWLLVCQCACVS